jgi:hypothetical protein
VAFWESIENSVEAWLPIGRFRDSGIPLPEVLDQRGIPTSLRSQFE